MNGDLVAARFETQERTYAKERVAGDLFATFDGFEEESVGLAVGDRKERGNGREQVSGNRLGDGNERRVRDKRENSLKSGRIMPRDIHYREGRSVVPVSRKPDSNLFSSVAVCDKLRPYLAGPACHLAPQKLRVPTCVLSRKGRGWRRCEHTGSVCGRLSSFRVRIPPAIQI